MDLDWNPLGTSVKAGQPFVQGSLALRRSDGMLLKNMTVVEHAGDFRERVARKFRG